MRPFDRCLAVLTLAAGASSMLGLSAFLAVGSLQWIDLGLSRGNALLLDGLLCLGFFLQHSVMVRRSFRDGLRRWLPDRYHLVLYALASGLALLLLVLLWQRVDPPLWRAEGALRWGLRGVPLLVVGGFLWSVRALGSFDTFGLRPLRDPAGAAEAEPMPLTVRGPYRCVRHPLYFLMLLFAWGCPTISPDRLLFNVLWTLWVLLGTWLEERDLVHAFGDDYRHYQSRVPMLLPWKGHCWKPARTAAGGS